MLQDKYIGLGLAISSSLFIGVSFVITKKGLIDATKGDASNGSAADSYSYLHSSKWWVGMLTMILGELANFAAYSYAPAILVTPLGALSVLISAILASVFLEERLRREGKMGCALSIIGAVIIILHAPEEKQIDSVDQIMYYAMQPGFVLYVTIVVTSVFYLIYRIAPRHGRRNMMVYVGICSLVGSISVMACKGVGITLKLTLEGNNQLRHPSTYFFVIVAAIGLLTQMNFFNKALDQFSTNLVTPIYYVLFTTATITASAILFQGFYNTNLKDIISVFAGFLTIFIGVFLLNHVKELPSHVPPSEQHAIDVYDEDDLQFSPSVSANFACEENIPQPALKGGSVRLKGSSRQFSQQFHSFTDNNGSSSISNHPQDIIPSPFKRATTDVPSLKADFGFQTRGNSIIASFSSHDINGRTSNGQTTPTYPIRAPADRARPSNVSERRAPRKTSAPTNATNERGTRKPVQSHAASYTQSSGLGTGEDYHSTSAPSPDRRFPLYPQSSRRSSEEDLPETIPIIDPPKVSAQQQQGRYSILTSTGDGLPSYTAVAQDDT